MATGVRQRRLGFQAPVENELRRVDRQIAGLFDSSGGLIGEVGRHVLAGNGKRVRPTLLLLAARRNGGASAPSILAAAVVELIHLATLIHDDSVDRSMLRRGLPTVNSMYSDQISVIMGDFVYSRAFAMMMERGLFEEMTILAVTAHVMSRGEMRQLERKNRLHMSEDEYLEVIDEKTASLFGAACRIGAMMGGSPEAERWETFGREYGRAFQITDDLFDFIGNEAAMGKAQGSDIKGGRVTLPLIAALRTATPRGRARVEEIVDDGVRDGQWEELVDFIRRHGGFDYCFERAADHARRAHEFAERLEMETDSREAILEAVSQVTRRRR